MHGDGSISGLCHSSPQRWRNCQLFYSFSFSLSRKDDVLYVFLEGLMPYLLVIGVVDALLMLQPHYSATILVTGVAVIMLFVAGARIWHLVLLVIPVIPLGIYFAISRIPA